MTPSCPPNTAAWLRPHGFAAENVHKQREAMSEEGQGRLGGAVWAGPLVYLCRNADEQQPLLFGVCAVVDDLTAGQAGVAVKDFDGLGVTLHAPMVDGVVGHQGNGVERDPLPEGHIVRHGVSLHLALHLNVENLQSLCGCKHGRRRLTYSQVDEDTPPPI